MEAWRSIWIRHHSTQPSISSYQKKHALDTIKSRLWQTSLCHWYCCIHMNLGNIPSIYSLVISLASTPRMALLNYTLANLEAVGLHLTKRKKLASYFREPCLERRFTSESTDIQSTRGCKKTCRTFAQRKPYACKVYIMSPCSSDPSAKIQRQHSMCWTPHLPLTHFPSELII